MELEYVKKVRSSRAFTVLDCVVVTVLVAVIAVSAWLIYRLPSETVTLSVGGSVRRISLGADAEIDLGHLTVIVRDGEVWVENADCPDKLCEKTGHIGRAGQSIVCLPHGIVITVGGKSDLQWEVGR